MRRAVRSQTVITYHGRTGYPKLHWTDTGKSFIMVRAKGGGVKRLYLDTKKATKTVHGIGDLRQEARRRRR
jgi:hypothetical protein